MKLRRRSPTATAVSGRGASPKYGLILDIRPKRSWFRRSAPQVSAKGSFVYVVKDATAELRPVKLGQRQAELVVDKRGLKAGERVVVQGQLGVTPGGKVRIPTAPAHRRRSFQPESQS